MSRCGRSSDTAADGNVPAVSRGCGPICRNDRRADEIPAAGQVVIHEGLQEQLAHVLAAGGAGNRPKLPPKNANDPRLWHHKGDRARTYAELARPDLRICRGRERDRWADAPDLARSIPPVRCRRFG